MPNQTLESFYRDYKINCDKYDFNKGHKKQYGKLAGKYVNPYYRVFSDDKIYYLYELKDNYFVIDDISKNKIENYEEINKTKLTFYYMNNGYIGCHFKEKNLYIHQIIKNFYGNGQGTMNGSIDHIDRNPLNNIYSNLRICDNETQQNNKIGTLEGTKRKRKKNAQKLPNGITQDMLPKYVVYHKEEYNKEKHLFREFFQIESHPKLNKQLAGSKSIKISIKDKLIQIKEILNKINNNISLDEIKKKDTPPFVSKRNINNKTVLNYDNRNTKHNLKYTIDTNLSMDENYKIFEDKLNEKYNTNTFDFSDFYKSLKNNSIKEIDNKVDTLENKDNKDFTLPKSFTVLEEKGLKYILFQKTFNGKRYAKKHRIKSNLEFEYNEFIEKLKVKCPELKEYLESLKEEIVLPKYYSISKINDEEYLTFNQTINGKRYCKRIKIKDNNIKEAIEKLKEKVKKTCFSNKEDL